MAEVYRAWDQREGQWCALKVLNEKYASDPAARTRFVAEGKTVIALDHRNVIDAWDLIDRARRPFLVMEIAEGGSLKDWVDRHGQMPPQMAADVAIQISKGIGAAHRIGVVHRDVKPHNILLNRRGLCKVTDFGIAQILRPDGSTDIPDARTLGDQNVMGTLGYMAPEQRTNPHSADVRTDVYGIGATLFTLLTGRVVTNLFIADREPALLAEIPDGLVPVLMRATGYRPDQRYDTVQDLARALFTVRSELPADPADSPGLAPVLPPEPPPPRSHTDLLDTPLSEAPTPITSPSRSSAPRPTPGAHGASQPGAPPAYLGSASHPGPPPYLGSASHPGPPPAYLGPTATPRPAPPAAPPIGATLTPEDSQPPQITQRYSASPTPMARRIIYEEPPQRTRPLVVIATLVGMLVSSMVIDKIRVDNAGRRAMRAQQALIELAVEESGRISTLDDHGDANEIELKAQLRMLRTAPNPVLAESYGRAYLKSLKRAEAALPSNPSPEDKLEIAEAISGIARLEQQQQALSEALDAWAFAGRLPGCAGCLGAAHVPER